MWTRILALIRKEFLVLWQDPKSRFVLIVPPIIQLLIFAPAATFEISHVAFGIWDEDRGQYATELISRFTGTPAFHEAERFDNPAAVADAIDAERVRAVLHIGQSFTADLKAGRPAGVQLVLDGRRSNTALIVQNYATSLITAFNLEHVPALVGKRGVDLIVRAWFNPNLESQWFILPGLTVLLTTVVALLVTSLTIARERELGTFEQILVTPLRPMELLIGKTVPALVIGVIEADGIALAAHWLYQVPFLGRIGMFHVGVLVFLLSAIGIGLVISSITRTQQQAILGVFLFLAPAIILSGFATPIANMPDWCQLITYGNPVRYMLVLTRGIFLQDLPWTLAWAQLWPMALIGLITMSFSVWLFGRKLE